MTAIPSTQSRIYHSFHSLQSNAHFMSPFMCVQSASSTPFFSFSLPPGIKNLRILYLHANEITWLPGDLHAIWPRLRYLDIEWNPFHCDASLCPFLRWFARVTHNFTLSSKKFETYWAMQDITFLQDYERYKCATPSTETNKTLINFKFENCPDLVASGKAASTPSASLMSRGLSFLVLALFSFTSFNW